MENTEKMPVRKRILVAVLASIFSIITAILIDKIADPQSLVEEKNYWFHKGFLAIVMFISFYLLNTYARFKKK